MAIEKIAFVASEAEEAQAALEELTARYSSVPIDDAEVIVPIGGDGFMLQTLHANIGRDVPFYGINRGSVGFLLNQYEPDHLIERIQQAETAVLHPLKMRATAADGVVTELPAINEVSMLRQTHQAAKLRISINGVVRLEELICDGILVSTPAGSTAYNLSAHGPILPLDAQLLAVTPISAFRPRRWRGALLPRDAKIRIDVLQHRGRPVAAVADSREVRNVTSVDVYEDRSVRFRLLFDSGHGLEERILHEQFVP